MTWAAGPYLAACLLLVAAGVAKIYRPDTTRRALTTVAHRAVPSIAVRLAGGAEILLGTAAVVVASPTTALAVAATYVIFAGFSFAFSRTPTPTSCGCFGAGSEGVPTSLLHVIVNLAAALAALSVATDGGLPADRAVVTVLAAGLAYATYLLLVPLPRLRAAIQGTRTP